MSLKHLIEILVNFILNYFQFQGESYISRIVNRLHDVALLKGNIGYPKLCITKF